MNNKKAKEVIEEYKPHKGFFDLSNKPKTLNNIEYAQILDTQNLLARMEKDKEYLIENRPLTWEQMKNVSATLQGIIFQHWGDSVFD